MLCETIISRYINDPQRTWTASTRQRNLMAISAYLVFCAYRGYIIGNPAKNVSVDLRLLSHEQKEPRHPDPFVSSDLKKLLASTDMYLAASRDATKFASMGKRETRVYQYVKKNAPAIIRADACKALKVDTALIDSMLENEMLYIRYMRDRGRADEWTVLIRLAWATGMRLTDAVSLELNSLCVPGHIIVHTGKRGIRVQLPVDDVVTPGLAEALTLMVFEPGEQYCFPRLRADLLKNKSTLSVTFGRMVKRAGIEGNKTFHSFRHTRFTAWKKAGFSLEQCQEFGGHAKGSSATAAYLHVD